MELRAHTLSHLNLIADRHEKPERADHVGEPGDGREGGGHVHPGVGELRVQVGHYPERRGAHRVAHVGQAGLAGGLGHVGDHRGQVVLA